MTPAEVDVVTGTACADVVAMLVATSHGDLLEASRIATGMDATQRLWALSVAVGTLSTFVGDGSLDVERLGLHAARMALGESL